MEERRKNRRIELGSRILVKRLDQQGEEEEVSIDIVDVSKTGVGFACGTLLTIGAVYEAYMTIWTKEVIHAFIEIVRISKKDGIFEYGGIFVGMPEVEAQRIEIYDTVSKLQE